MKKHLIILPLLLLWNLSFSQNPSFGQYYGNTMFQQKIEKQALRYSVQGKYIRSVLKERLNKASLMSDLVKEYPTSWVKDYVSTELTGTCNGKVVNAKGINGHLNSAQKDILKMADLNTDVVVKVQYKQENAATNKIDIHTMNFIVTVIPKREASYLGGEEGLNAYLDEQIGEKLSDKEVDQLKDVKIEFTISKEGKVSNVHLSQPSVDTKIDQLLLNIMHEMPNWKPAKNSKGVNVQQEFNLFVGTMNGC